MKKYIQILFLICISLASKAQVQTTKAYIEKYKMVAIQEMKRTGIPASITLAQAIVESSSGESNLAKKFNNHFGIKCKLDWKGETTYQDDDTKKECFRVYNDAISSFKDHSDFLKNRPNYASLFELDPVDDSAWAYGLKKAGYATAADYPRKLLKVIDDYELSQYNYPAELVASAPTIEPTVKDTTKPVASIAIEKAKSDTLVKKADTAIVKATDTVQLSNVKGISSNNNATKASPQAIKQIGNLPKDSLNSSSVLITITKKKVVTYPKAKFKINGVSVIWANEGRSYLEIASTYKISLYKLYLYNDIQEADLVQHDQLVFLGQKKKESKKKIHIVKAGETLYEISQAEGIQLSALEAHNPNMKGKDLAEGTNLLLFQMPGEKKNNQPSFKDYSIKVDVGFFKNWHLFKKKK